MLRNNPADIEAHVLPNLTFDSMKRNMDRFQPVSVTWKPGYKFIRKGEVGDHKALLSETQQARFKECLQVCRDV